MKKGLTLSDLRQYKTGVPVTMAHIAAHQEIKGLVHSLRLAPMQAADIADMQTDPDRRILILKVAAQWIRMAEQLEALARP